MINRRRFLTTGAAMGTGVAADRLLTGPPEPVAAAPSATDGSLAQRVAFEGEHQAGILTERPRHAVFVSFDAITSDRAELAEAIRSISARARALTAGHRTLLGSPAEGPTPESGILGTKVTPDALTVTIGFGASLFDSRFGLRSRRPRGLKPMPTFPDDALVADQTHGDLIVQLCANTEETLINALRDVMRVTRPALAVRWKVDGFLPAPRESGAGRNLLGFKDGSSNPDTSDPAQMDRLVWTSRSDHGPAWTAGGTYAAVRVIRNRVEFWDRVSLSEQELMIGRSKGTGAPLGRRHEQDDPGFQNDDPHGKRIPLDAHIRLARPRTAATEGQRILRRGYNYSRGVDEAGQLDMGLVFVAFNRDLERQFEAVQKRLAGEPLVDYVKPTGGGYFFMPPGAGDSSDWVGSGLFV